MVKGVNRQVVEINDTGSVYFERILLVVRPERTEDERKIKEEADRIVKSYLITSKPPDGQRKEKKSSCRKNILFKMGMAAGAGAAVAATAMRLFC